MGFLADRYGKYYVTVDAIHPMESTFRCCQRYDAYVNSGRDHDSCMASRHFPRFLDRGCSPLWVRFSSCAIGFGADHSAACQHLLSFLPLGCRSIAWVKWAISADVWER